MPSSPQQRFSTDWASGLVQDRQALSPKRLAVEYSCTYLNRRTLQAFGTVVDAGCGIGYLQRYLEQQAWAGRYVGVDQSLASLSAARMLFPSARFVFADLTALPYPSQAIDLVYARDSVIHCSAPYDAVNELHRISRCLLLRVRTADVGDVFTAHYRHIDIVHQWLNPDRLIHFVSQLRPRPSLIRYRVHTRHPRTFDRQSFQELAPFSRYFVTDVLVVTDRVANQAPVHVIDDTRTTRFSAAWHRLLAWRAYVRPHSHPRLG